MAFSSWSSRTNSDVRSPRTLGQNGSANLVSDGTKLADQIRRYAVNKVIEPARIKGEHEIVLRAGDVHRDLGLRNRLPAVCAALGANLFLKLASIELLRESGPANGASKAFTYNLSPTPHQNGR
jgi:hypothetical protein